MTPHIPPTSGIAGQAHRTARCWAFIAFITVAAILLAQGCTPEPRAASGAASTEDRYPSFPGAAWHPAEPVLPDILPSEWTLLAPRNDAPQMRHADGMLIRVFMYRYGAQSAGASLSGDSGSYRFDSEAVRFEGEGSGEFGVAQSAQVLREFGQYHYRFMAGQTLWLLAGDGGTESAARTTLARLAAAIASKPGD